MKHVAYKYSVIHSLKELEGKSIVEVLELGPLTYIITNGTFLILWEDGSEGKGECNWAELKPSEKEAFTAATGILEDQIYPEIF